MNDSLEIKRKIESLQAQEEYYRTRAFYLIIEFAFIFGIPAFTALWLGQWLDDFYHTDDFWLTVSLVVAFILSWSIVIWRYLQLDRQMRQVNNLIKAERSKLKDIK